jgi:hypothetical protein
MILCEMNTLRQENKVIAYLVDIVNNSRVRFFRLIRNLSILTTQSLTPSTIARFFQVIEKA